MGICEQFRATRAFEDIAQRDLDDCEELSRSELRAGRISWDYMADSPGAELQKGMAMAARRDPPGIYDELQFTVEPHLPPEFWRGIMIAAGASSVLWVGAFYLLTWWIA